MNSITMTVYADGHVEVTATDVPGGVSYTIAAADEKQAPLVLLEDLRRDPLTDDACIMALEEASGALVAMWDLRYRP